MTKPLIHFSHGNSYPAGSYTRFLDYLRADYDVRAVEIIPTLCVTVAVERT